MNRKLAISLTSLFLMPGLGFCKKEGVVITYAGGSVSEEDVRKSGGRNLYQAEMQLYQMRMQVAQQIIQERITDIEAKKTGKSIETLESEYMANNYQPPAEADLQAFFLQNSKKSAAQDPEGYAGFRTGSLKQATQQARQRFYSQLMQKYELKPVAAEPEKPKFERIKVDVDDDPYWGNKNAKVVVVEFSDFECPYCTKMQQPIRRLKQDYEGKIKWVFRDFPLPFHQRARKAHIAANCAGKQGKYFSYTSKLFDTKDLSEDSLTKIARSENLNIAAFNQCVADPQGLESAEIDKDASYGQKIGVSGTPTLFINGELVSGLLSYEQLKESIDNELR